MTRISLPALLVLAVLAPPLSGQIEPGRTYNPGEVVHDPDSGLTVTIPGGWRGSLAPGGAAFLLGPLSGDGLMIILGDQATEAEARAQLSTSIPLGNGIVLEPSGEVEGIGPGHFTNTFAVRGAGAELRGAADVRMTDTGLGVGFMLVSPPATYDAHRDDLRALALSLGVTELVASPAASGNDEWEPWLRGAYLARFYTGSGYTESTELWLCTDGSFFYNDQAGGFGGGASGAYQNATAGRWSASGAGGTGTLVLDWANGERSTWALEYDYDQGRTYVNGNRWLRGENERCG